MKETTDDERGAMTLRTGYMGYGSYDGGGGWERRMGGWLVGCLMGGRGVCESVSVSVM